MPWRFSCHAVLTLLRFTVVFQDESVHVSSVFSVQIICQPKTGVEASFARFRAKRQLQKHKFGQKSHSTVRRALGKPVPRHFGAKTLLRSGDRKLQKEKPVPCHFGAKPHPPPRSARACPSRSLDLRVGQPVPRHFALKMLSDIFGDAARHAFHSQEFI